MLWKNFIEIGERLAVALGRFLNESIFLTNCKISLKRFTISKKSLYLAYIIFKKPNFFLYIILKSDKKRKSFRTNFSFQVYIFETPKVRFFVPHRKNFLNKIFFILSIKYFFCILCIVKIENKKNLERIFRISVDFPKFWIQSLKKIQIHCNFNCNLINYYTLKCI